jgi:hypothetical protein
MAHLCGNIPSAILVRCLEKGAKKGRPTGCRVSAETSFKQFDSEQGKKTQECHLLLEHDNTWAHQRDHMIKSIWKGPLA